MGAALAGVSARATIADSFPGTGTNSTAAGQTIRNQCEILRGMLETERSTFLTQWRELGAFILPRRPRFTITDTNKGGNRTQAIIDSTGTFASRTLAAGLMSAMTSASRPWFRLMPPNPDLQEDAEVMRWLEEVTERMQTAFLQSNLYTVLPTLYSDMGVFGTGVMLQKEDPHSIFRFYPFPIGTYNLANDNTGRTQIFLRTFELSVQQVVDMWGDKDESGRPNWLRGEPTTISTSTQQLYERGNLAAWVQLCHVIRPNQSYDRRKMESKYKRFEEVYYEWGAPDSAQAPYGLLAHTGYDEFPVFVGRWEVNAEDVYATNCPGMTALGDIRQLQMGERRVMQAVEKQINPPMTGPTSLRSVKTSLLPGDITYLDAGKDNGFRPVHEIRFDISQMEMKQQQVRQRIKEAFFADLFLMLSSIENNTQMTATEVLELKDEKLTALGPMYGQFNSDVLDPLIDRTFALMLRKGLFPPTPEALIGMVLKVEYLSIIAQALKAQGISGLERFVAFVGQVAAATAQPNPTWDRVNVDEVITAHALMTGIAPKNIRSEDEVAAMRQAQAQAAAQQQKMAALEQASKTAKNLAQSPMGAEAGDNALSRLMASRGQQSVMQGVPNAVPAGVPAEMAP